MRLYLLLLIGLLALPLKAGFAPSKDLHYPSERSPSNKNRNIPSKKRPVADSENDLGKNQAQQLLSQYLQAQKETLEKTAHDHVKDLMKNLDDPKKLLEALNALFFENQLSVSAEGIEQEVFGKQLAEFPMEVRHFLVKAYTEGQKEYRDQLISKISESLSEMNDLKAIQLSRALLKAKEKHLEAYDRVIKNIPETDGKDSWCFTCNPTGEIAKGSGYTFEKAMDEAISEVMKSLPIEQSNPKEKAKPQPKLKPPEKKQQPIAPPKPPSEPAQTFLPDHSRLQVPGLSSRGTAVPRELQGSVSDLLRGKQVLLLGNPTGCPPCQKAAAFLRQRGIPFEEAPVRSNPQAGQVFRNLRGQKFPLMIHSDGNGGFIYRYPNW